MNTAYYLINKNKDVFWGLLFDIMTYYLKGYNKRKRNMPNLSKEGDGDVYFLDKESQRQKKEEKTRTISSRKSYKKIKNNFKKKNDSKAILTFKESNAIDQEINEGLEIKKSHLQKYNKSQIRASFTNNIKDNIVYESQRTTSQNYVDLDIYPKKAEDTDKTALKNFENIKRKVTVFFKRMKVIEQTEEIPIEDLKFDKTRNGVFLGFLISKIHKTSNLKIIEKPKTVEDCLRNLERCFGELRNSEDCPISEKLLWDVMAFIKTDAVPFWSIYYQLMFQYEEKLSLVRYNLRMAEKQCGINADSIKKGNILYYRIVGHLNSINGPKSMKENLNTNLSYKNFQDVLKESSSCLVLGKLLLKSSKKDKIDGFNWKPINNRSKFKNLKICLNLLRSEFKFYPFPQPQIDDLRLNDFQTWLSLYAQVLDCLPFEKNNQKSQNRIFHPQGEDVLKKVINTMSKNSASPPSQRNKIEGYDQTLKKIRDDFNFKIPLTSVSRDLKVVNSKQKRKENLIKTNQIIKQCIDKLELLSLSSRREASLIEQQPLEILESKSFTQMINLFVVLNLDGLLNQEQWHTTIWSNFSNG